jgi:hypothetical protein
VTARLLVPDRWRRLDPAMWQARWWWFLGDDRPAPATVAPLLVNGTYLPDTFTVADRYTQPAWLSESERDGDTWLHQLVTRRVGALGDQPPATVSHVYDQARRLLFDLPHQGIPVAASLYNQEAPYVVDRLAAWCLTSRPWQPVDRFAGLNRLGHLVVKDLLTRHGHHAAAFDPDRLLRVAVAAGLVGLDLKGGPAPPGTTIPLAGWSPGPATTTVWRRLSEHAAQPAPVDHGPGLLDETRSGPVRLVWWADDLIETALDLLVIQHLVTVNPRLRVVVVPKNGRYDNDAHTGDVTRIVRHPALAGLRRAVAAGRVHLSVHGPRMATAHPLRLHPALVREIASADVMLCKGGRVHEMFNGNLAVPSYTAYVLVREFMQGQAGYDPATAPTLVFRADVGQWPWWGFRGRTTARRLPSGHTVAACHSTIAERLHRAATTDVGWLAADLARLVDLWPAFADRYATAAGQEIALLRRRLAELQAVPDPPVTATTAVGLEHI